MVDLISARPLGNAGARTLLPLLFLHAPRWRIPNEGGVTGVDWFIYPVLRFDVVLQAVDVHIVGRPSLLSLDGGQGPTADATGKRVRAVIWF